MSSFVLVVEDDPDNRELLQLRLEAAGYSVVACESGLDALTTLQSGRHPCLIVLDLNMPDVSGFRFRAEQRHDPALKDIPVVAMSGVAEPDAYHGNLQAIGYLRKPFDVDEILTFVRRACGTPRRSVRDLRE